MKIKYTHQKSQSYAAGALTAKLYNIYHSRRNLPSVIFCLKEFRNLRVVLGKYYNLLKANKFGNSFVLKYEEFDRINLDRTLIGSPTDFFHGYCDTIKKQKL